MNVITIALKDLLVLAKKPGSMVLLFLVPLVFVVVFSGALGAIGEGEVADTRIPLPVVDLDGGEAAQTLIDELDAAGGVRVERYEQAEAMALLSDNEVARVLTIPAGLTAAFAERGSVTLRLVSHPDADPEQTEAIRLVVDGVARDMSLEAQIFAALQQMGEMQAGDPDAAQAFGAERAQAQARSQFERAQDQPLVAVVQKVPGQKVEKLDLSSVADVAVPGAAVLFIFMAAQTTAQSIYDEKKVGSFRRLLAAPMGKVALLGGKVLYNWLTGMIQAAVIVGFALLVLPLLGMTPVTMGVQPLVTVLAIMLIALCSGALGVLIAALARTEGQVGGISTLILWGMAILGGSFIPVFLLERFLGPLPMIIPHYWANRALLDLMVRGLGLADVAVALAALVGFTVVFFVVGLWRFEFN